MDASDQSGPASRPPRPDSRLPDRVSHRPERRKELGRRGEELAARHLEAAGFRILDRNWRAGRRELDIVALDGDVIAFVEVKARGRGPQAPLEALGRPQRRDLRRAAEAWIQAHPGVGREFRFDLVAVRAAPGEPPRVEHVRDAFYGDDC